MNAFWWVRFANFLLIRLVICGQCRPRCGFMSRIQMMEMMTTAPEEQWSFCIKIL
jgi:hypothetical protein